MVGLIQKLLMDLIEESAGADAVAEVMRRAEVPVDRVFRMDEVYEDAEWQRLLGATCAVLDITAEQAEEAYADFFFKDSQRRWPMWFQMSKNAREFLIRQPVIHNGFATGVRDAESRQAITDKFEVEEKDQDLVVHYRSPNKLCGLYMKLAERIINHYGDKATVSEKKCSKNGDVECEIHVQWARNFGVKCGDS